MKVMEVREFSYWVERPASRTAELTVIYREGNISGIIICWVDGLRRDADITASAKQYIYMYFHSRRSVFLSHFLAFPFVHVQHDVYTVELRFADARKMGRVAKYVLDKETFWKSWMELSWVEMNGKKEYRVFWTWLLSLSDWLDDQSINQSIKIYFLNGRNITVYASTQKAAIEALNALNWPPKQTKQHRYEYKQEGGKDSGEQTITFAAKVQVETQSLINLQYVYSLV